MKSAINKLFKDKIGLSRSVLAIILIGWFIFISESVYADSVGSLHVTITPQGAIDAGSQWRVDGGAWHESGVYLGLGVGSHIVEYKVIDGWDAPSNVNIDIIEDEITELTAIYSLETGSLVVTLSPQGAIDLGAQWNVDGGLWQNSGARVGSLTPGDHMVNYKNVIGWNAPSSATVTILARHITEETGTYVQQQKFGSLQVNITPQAVVDAGAKWNVDGGKWQESGMVVNGLTAGPHTLSYKGVFGWENPPDTIATVLSDQVTEMSDAYIELFGQTTIHVPKDYTTIQAAINAAFDGDTVLVADGTYVGLWNKDLDFDGKAIRVMSDNGPEKCIIDCENEGRGFYFHNNEKQDSVMSGFSIRNGFVNKGGGINIYESAPTIINCNISGNTASSTNGNGGGIYILKGYPDIINSTISENLATSSGGGIYISEGSAIITGCTISENSAGADIQRLGIGGGIYGGSAIISGCKIRKNYATIGGGIYGGYHQIINCVITGNEALKFNDLGVIGPGRGGAIYGGEHLFYNCTIIDNFAASTEDNYGSIIPGEGGGIYGGSHVVTNCIFMRNSPNEIISNAVVTYSDIQGGYTGAGNIDADPLFVDEDNEDYRLTVASPCINSGTSESAPSTDFEGQSRPQGAGYDMGAYEFPLADQLIIKASAGPNGAIEPSGFIFVSYGRNQTFLITPNTEYEISDVHVDGLSVGPVSTYSFLNVTTDHSITATFFNTKNRSISGYVRSEEGIGIPGVEMKGLPGNPTTEADGSYSVNVENEWSGTVTPQKGLYSFVPAFRSYDSVTNDYTDQNYILDGNFCVSNEAELQTALNIAVENGKDSTIKIVQGTYNGTFFYVSTLADNLVVEGGYKRSCASREIDPGNTILDGRGEDTVMALISQKEADFIVEGLTFRNGKNSTLNYGGGLYSETNGQTNLRDNIFRENTSSSSGGGVYVKGRANLNHNIFTENRSKGNGGGASIGGSQNEIENNTFSRNKSSTYGGGIYLRGSSKLDNNTFTENSTGVLGGGAFVKNTTLNNNLFTNNRCDNNGGGVYGNNSTLTNTVFSGNLSGNNGGGVSFYAGGNIIDCTFIGNTAGVHGGGAHTYGSGILINNIFVENASAHCGGGIYAKDGSFSLINNTVTENDAGKLGGGVCISFDTDKSIGKIYNNIIWKNHAPEASSIYINNQIENSFFPALVHVFNNDLDKSDAGITITAPFPIDSSNLDNVDPLFIGDGNYHLLSSSLCIDAGDNDAPNIPSFDKEGNQRIVYDKVDMGAYEYNLSAPIADAGPDKIASSGESLSLDGSNSSDPESGPLAYAWTQIAGTNVTLSDPAAVAPTFTVPGASLNGEIIFSLTVTNNSNLMNTDWVTIKIEGNSIIYAEPDGQCGGNVPCYFKILNGIDSQYEPATIRVGSGSYVENIVIDKKVTLELGWDPDFITLDQPVPVVLRSTPLLELACNPSNDHCYRLNNKAMTAGEATNYADQDGGYLASITSADEGQWLYDTFGSDLIDYGTRMFGASDSDFEGNWEWLSGEIWSYTNWNSGEPNNWNDNEDCIAFASKMNPGNGFLWNDVRCGNKYVSLIEYDFDPMSNY